MKFFTEAYATNDTVPATSTDAGMYANLIPLLLVFVIFYVLLIRPQQKKMKEHQKLIEGIRRGDKVVTAGGIIGIIHKVEQDDNTVHVEIAPEVRVKVLKSTISEVLNRAGEDEGKKN